MSCLRRSCAISDTHRRRLSRRSGAWSAPEGPGFRRSVAAVVLGCLVLLVAAPLSAKEFRFGFHDTLKVGEQPRIDIACPDGRLQVIGTSDQVIVIEATKIVHAVGMDEAREIAEGFTISTGEHGGTYQVHADYQQLTERKRSLWKKLLGKGEVESYGTLDWIISVPADCELHVNGQHGEISISHIRGKVSVKSSTAEISLASIEGEIEVQNTSGATTGEFLFGPLTVRQAMGLVKLQYVEGDTRIKSTSADINLIQERGAIDIETVAGNVDIQTNLNSNRDYFVETESGHIRLAIPETSSADLRIESEVGEIQIDVPVTLRTMSDRLVEGEFGYGGVRVSLRSVSGDVTVAEN